MPPPFRAASGDRRRTGTSATTSVPRIGHATLTSGSRLSLQSGNGNKTSKRVIRMQSAISTRIVLRERLQPSLLDSILALRPAAIEIFAARQHFDYTDREHIAEIAAWFAAHNLTPWALHAPQFPDREMGRAGAPAVNLLHPEKSRRIDAMDEVKRALESADQLHFAHLVVELGERGDSWSPRTLENALTALEHLDAFARPLGVRLLAKNGMNEPSQPERLVEILAIGHLTRVGIALDLGHAHATCGIAAAFAATRGHLASLRAHDNHGFRDEHLWPGKGSLDWPQLRASASAADAANLPCFLDLPNAGLIPPADFAAFTSLIA